MQKILLGALAITIIGAAFVVSNFPVLAATNPFTTACNEGGGSSAACHASSSDQLTGRNGVISKVTRLVAIVAGFAAVIMIIVGGIGYITSSGDSSKAASARNTIIYAAIGLVVIGLAQAIITFIVSKV